MKSHVHKVTPVHEEKDLYFNQFQAMWKTNASGRVGGRVGASSARIITRENTSIRTIVLE